MTNPKPYSPSTCSKAVRLAVLIRYNYCCAVCGCPDPDNLSMDRADCSLGYTLDNTQCLCRTCNCTIKIAISAPMYAPRQPVLDINDVLSLRQLYRWILGRKLKDPTPYVALAA